MIKTIVILISIVFIGKAFGQPDGISYYQDLETKKVYSFKSHSTKTDGKIQTYAINNKPVSKETYEKYVSTLKNLETCCPCILKIYNENELLISESVSCQDCAVGYFKDFYSNGNIKTSGHYKENTTGNWDSIW